MSNSKLALVSGPKLYKTIDKQITDITGNKLKLAFIFETIDSLTTYIKNVLNIENCCEPFLFLFFFIQNSLNGQSHHKSSLLPLVCS